MATKAFDRGTWTIRFRINGQPRRRVRLGVKDEQAADGVLIHVRRMIEAVESEQPLYAETARWLAKINDALHARFARNGLCAPREPIVKGPTLLEYIDRYIAKRRPELKPGSAKMLEQGRDKLVGHFGAECPLEAISADDALAFKTAMLAQNSAAYAAKLTMLAKQFFRRAVKDKVLAESPFLDVKPGSQVNEDRLHFVPADVIEQVILAEKADPERGLVYALGRYAGIRIPSELTRLKWSDFDFTKGTMTVHSPKTEHHTGGAKRTVPIFPELRPHLARARAVAKDGDGLVCPKYARNSVNLRTHFEDTLRSLKIKQWPRLIQNLRASRETELAERYPLYKVCRWLGNSPSVAMKHYLHIGDTDFAHAAGLTSVVQLTPMGPKSGPASPGVGQQAAAPLFGESIATSAFAAINENMPAGAGMCKNGGMGAVGFEPTKA